MYFKLFFCTEVSFLKMSFNKNKPVAVLPGYFPGVYQETGGSCVGALGPGTSRVGSWIRALSSSRIAREPGERSLPQPPAARLQSAGGLGGLLAGPPGSHPVLLPFTQLRQGVRETRRGRFPSPGDSVQQLRLCSCWCRLTLLRPDAPHPCGCSGLPQQGCAVPRGSEPHRKKALRLPADPQG